MSGHLFTFYKYYVDSSKAIFTQVITFCSLMSLPLVLNVNLEIFFFIQPLMLGQSDLLAVHLLPAYKHAWIHRIALYMI